MLKYIFRRILMLIPVLLGVAFCVFTLLYFTPGDPARMVLGDLATDEAIKEFRDKEGLNDPFLVQFGNYVYKAVVHGDIGRSYSSKRPVMQEILTAYNRNTLRNNLGHKTILMVRHNHDDLRNDRPLHAGVLAGLAADTVLRS